MNTHKLVRILVLFLIVFLFCFIGTTLLKYRHQLTNDIDLLVQLLLFTSFIEIGIYYYAGEYKHKLNLNSIAFAILRIVLAIIYMNNILSLDVFCILWGIFECIRAAVNIPKNIYIVYRHREYLRIGETLVSVIEFVFGILLILGTISHLKGHLLVFGLTLFANAIIFTIDTVLSFLKHEDRH